MHFGDLLQSFKKSLLVTHQTETGYHKQVDQ